MKQNALTPKGVARMIQEVQNAVREPDQVQKWISGFYDDLTDYLMGAECEREESGQTSLRFVEFANALVFELEEDRP